MRSSKKRLGKSSGMKGKVAWNKGLRGHPSWNKGLTKETDERMAKQTKNHLKTLKNPNYKHPIAWNKGLPAWNKGLTAETDDRIRKAAKAMLGHVLRQTTYYEFIPELGHGVRSSWEKEFGLLLKNAGISYCYENTAFKFIHNNKVHTYHPDFQINDNFFIETKGFMREYDILMLNAFIEQHSSIKLIVLGLDNSSIKNSLNCRVISWANRKNLVEELKCL